MAAAEPIVMLTALSGVEDKVRAYELGAGSVLRGLVKRIAPAIEITTIGEPHEVDAFT